MTRKEIPIYTIEEHHEVFIVWHHAIQNRIILPSGNTLFHIDEHSDMGVPQFNSSIQGLNGNMKTIKNFAYEELGIASFIVPAVYQKIFDTIFWIKQKHNKPTPVHKEMFVRSYNNAGKKLFLGKMTEKLRVKVTDIENDIIGFDYHFRTIAQLDKASDIVLDIDLDYFSCAGNPNLQKEIRVEITKSEYDQFIEDKYHRLNFVGFNKIRAEIDSGRYYYVINDFNEIYPSDSYVDKKTIKDRVKEFCKILVSRCIEPKLISICRSNYSGYTSEDQCKFIQNTLLNEIGTIYQLKKRYCD